MFQATPLLLGRHEVRAWPFSSLVHFYGQILVKHEFEEQVPSLCSPVATCLIPTPSLSPLSSFFAPVDRSMPCVVCSGGRGGWHRCRSVYSSSSTTSVDDTSCDATPAAGSKERPTISPHSPPQRGELSARLTDCV